MFDHCMYFNTTALARQLEREWVQAFKPFGLTPPQAFMLRVILAQPGLLQREIADIMSISRPTATRALDGLQEKGLIRRTESQADGREWVIEPTEEAVSIKVALNEASGAVTKRLKRVLGGMQFDDTVSKIRGVRSALE